MKITPVKYNLSYMLGTVVWDGKNIANRPMRDICADMDLMKECGISEVMISGYHDEEPATFDMYEETKRLGAELEKRGMRPNQHHGVASSLAPVGTSQKKVIELLKRQIEYTANMRSPVLIFHPCKVIGRYESNDALLAAFQEEVNKHSLEDVIRQIADNLCEAADFARTLGVKLAVENVDMGEPLADYSGLPLLVRTANHPDIGYCLDAGHAHSHDDSILQWIEIMSMDRKLFITHFHDNSGADMKYTPGWIVQHHNDEHLPPGFGTIPWIDVIISLWKNNYTGTVNFESAPWPCPDRRKGFEYAINFWRNCEYFAEVKLAKMQQDF